MFPKQTIRVFYPVVQNNPQQEEAFRKERQSIANVIEHEKLWFEWCLLLVPHACSQQEDVHAATIYLPSPTHSLHHNKCLHSQFLHY